MSMLRATDWIWIAISSFVIFCLYIVPADPPMLGTIVIAFLAIVSGLKRSRK